MSEVYLALYLDAPLQAWGDSSHFDRRTTRDMPTKTGIIGMLCAALGIPREDESSVERLSGTLSIEEPIRLHSPKSAVQVMDYHTVGGGYDSVEQRHRIPVTADGKGRRTAVTYREYLADAKFGVLIRAPEKVAEQCSEALQNPTWGIWLGRKCCVPSAPVLQGVFGTYDEAVYHLLCLQNA